jgi:sugar (pentulose or hexulose) kinase
VRVVAMAEPEAAALGAAIQAAWTVRRLRGERVDCDAVAAPCVRAAGAVTAPSNHAPFYRDLLARFDREVRRQYGDAAGALP